ncbi:IS66 family element, transposase domain protein [Leptospira weilii str. LNT 1234]|nr:IS66 family element, transposase domain protein [Leptospira weilii str. LNT 1234]
MDRVSGIIQTDGYESYDSLLKSELKILHAGCWNHARRKFFDILKVDSNNAEAQWIVKEIGKLYAVESKAKLSSEEHLSLRQSESKPIVNEIRSWMNKRIVEVASKSSMGKALSYLAELSYAEEQRLRSASFCLKRFLWWRFMGKVDFVFRSSRVTVGYESCRE